MCELRLDGCEAVLLGEPDSGMSQRDELLLPALALRAATAVGLCRAGFEAAVTYSRERKAFGKPIHRFQEVGFKLSDMKMLIDAGGLITRNAAWLIDSNAPDATTVAGCAKVFCSEAASKVGSWAVQVHGGYGCLTTSVVERLYRDAKPGEISGGTNELHRMEIAAQCLRPFK